MQINEKEQNVILHKELDLIQSIISRMAQNSFIIKGWFFTLLTALSLWEFESIPVFIISIVLLTIVFYALNLQFYIYERCFRELYKSRIELRVNSCNYSKDLYSLDFSEFKNKWYYYVFQNLTLLITYFGVALILLVAKVQIIGTKQNATPFQNSNNWATIIINFFNF